ncbi:hypothetical protein E2C01_080937 [Portunus trituberculatus]|uniref:Uncharacterized protein n=1 Tax=Portunus trituberculatus TaxID=210409 RepID=A0A5B7IKX3_PORTR|nr:hypothetical protein [Portunus trituberculatus]
MVEINGCLLEEEGTYTELGGWSREMGVAVVLCWLPCVSYLHDKETGKQKKYGLLKFSHVLEKGFVLEQK